MDNEIKGVGNSINFKYRMHDPRLGRFFAIDPLAPKYPHYSPYSFSGNRVIAFVELEGLEENPLSDWLYETLKRPVGEPRDPTLEEAAQPHVAFTTSFISVANFKNRSIARWNNQAFYYKAVPKVQEYEYLGKITKEFGYVYELASTESNILLDIWDLADPILTLATAGRGKTLITYAFTKTHPKASLIKNAVSNGFYEVRNLIHEVTYVGKGAKKRAIHSLKVKKGDEVISYTVDKGVAGLDVHKTAFAMEHLLMEKVIKAGNELKNKISSPGKKIIKRLNEKQLEELKTAFNKIIEEGGEKIKNTQ